jgi:hypothetical protein
MYQIVPGTFLVFVDVGEDLIMVDDVATPLNLLIALVEEEKLKEASLDVNVSQQSCEEESSKRVVRNRVNCSTWDCRLSLNPHALIIYLEFVLACGIIVKLGFPVMTIIVRYKAQPTPFHGASNRIPSLHHSSHFEFFTVVIYPL